MDSSRENEAGRNPLKRALEYQRASEETARRMFWGDVSFSEYPLRPCDFAILRTRLGAGEHIPLLELREDVASRARELWEGLPRRTRLVLEAGVLVPLSAVSFARGLAFPDVDIRLLGIGSHRYFLFHSALSVFVLKRFVEEYQSFVADDPGAVRYDKVLASVAAGAGYGIALHLAADGLWQGGQDVTFGIPGLWQSSLVEGTLVDDNIWLVGNALYAFRLSNQVVALAFGEELAGLKRGINEAFGPLRED